MSPSEILNKAVEDANTDYISKEVGSVVAEWYKENEPESVTLLYMVAALVESVYRQENNPCGVEDDSEYDMTSPDLELK